MQDFSDLTAFIDRRGGELVTDSRAVALAFKKRHKNVLRIIDRMRASKRPLIAEHARLNFEPCFYAGRNGKTEPMYQMTDRGLTELAMGFSGDDSREIRIRFLNAFEKVAERLSSAERTIANMLYDLERREMPSAIKGQIGSKLMNERKAEKRDFAEERASLMAKAQPGLFLN